MSETGSTNGGTPSQRLEPGDQIDHFEIHELIGQGAVGRVYRATDTNLGRDVALKFLFFQDYGATPEEIMVVKERFIREARVLARVTHPNIIQIYEASLHDQFPYFAMELVPGITLDQRLEQGPKLTGYEVCVLARRMIDALAFAWERFQVIHRDLKPPNIMLGPQGLVKLLDLGLAKAVDLTDDGNVTEFRTRVGMVAGTPLYMAPEQHLGEADVDHRVDIFALGALMCRMFTDRYPFLTENLVALVQSKMSGVHFKIEDYAKDLPPDLILLLYDMLKANRDERIASYAEIDAVLARAERILAPADQPPAPSREVQPQAPAAAPAQPPPIPQAQPDPTPSQARLIIKQDGQQQPPKARPVQAPPPQANPPKAKLTIKQNGAPPTADVPPTQPAQQPAADSNDKFPKLRLANQEAITPGEVATTTAKLRLARPPKGGAIPRAKPVGSIAANEAAKSGSYVRVGQPPDQPAGDPVMPAVPTAEPNPPQAPPAAPAQPTAAPAAQPVPEAAGQPQPASAQLSPETGGVSITSTGDIRRSPGFAKAISRIAPGTSFGRYRITGMVGRGPFGIVFRAEDEQTGQQVAMKFLDTPNDPQLRNRFENVTKRLQGLQHESICPYLGSYFNPPYVAIVERLVTMPNNKAMNLHGYRAKYAEADGHIPQRQVLKVAFQLASALAAAHRAGIIHGSIKPENIMFQLEATEDELWRLRMQITDFGILEILGFEFFQNWLNAVLDAGVVMPQAVLETALYCAPEQWEGAPPSALAEQFATSSVVHYFLTGYNDPEPRKKPSVYRPEIEPAWDPILCKPLRTDPKRRFDSIDELVECFNAIDVPGP